MANGLDSGPIHPDATQSGYRYNGRRQTAFPKREAEVVETGPFMNVSVANGKYQNIQTRPLSFPGSEISWAGQSPSGVGLCFGSDDGRLMFLEPGQEPQVSSSIVESGEAINGVAFIKNHIAVSTRSEVVFFDMPLPGEPKLERDIFEGGAHGIVVTSSGRFVAPLGPRGLLSFRYEPGSHQTMKMGRPPGTDFVFYKLANLGQSKGADVFAVAARRHGMLRAVLADESYGTFAFSHAGVDIVDVCSLGMDRLPFAAVGLTLDGTILLFEDVFKEGPPYMRKFNDKKERGYRILSAQGHLIVHTSDAIYILENYIRDFLQEGKAPMDATMHTLALEAVDVFVVHGQRLVVVLPEGAFDVDIALLLKETNSANTGMDEHSYSRGSDKDLGFSWSTDALPTLTFTAA